MHCSENPSLTGKSDSKLGKWNGKKTYGAGNEYSSNVVFNCGNITKATIGALDVEKAFTLIPFTEEVQKAGYTFEDTKMAAVWYGPVSDGKYFWYTSFRYNIFTPFLPSILVCRKVKNGKLVYTKNCNDYNMDTSMNAPHIIVRVTPAIKGNKLYLTSSSATNIGPQLFAIEKLTGTLIWSYAYYPPSPLMPTSVKSDYSAYSNTHVRLGDTCPIVIKDDFVVVGASSIQNAPVNIGVRSGKFPVYTDQGNVFIVQDHGSYPSMHLKWSSCPPILKAGDQVTSDSFLPGFNYTVIGTVSINNPVDMYLFGSDPEVPVPPSPAFPNSSPIVAIYNGGDTMFTQDIWNSVDKIYINKDRVNGYAPADVFNHLSPGQNYIWAYLDQTLIDLVTMQPNNSGLYFYKKIMAGVIANEHDAQGLNYYGNSNWGPACSFIDNKLFFGTGQIHAMPFLEEYLYNSSPDSFLNKTIPVAIASNMYVSNPTSQNLLALNNAKDDLTTTMRTTFFGRSPRGSLSYSDSIVCIDFNDGFKFAIRHIPHDVYTFLALDPNYILVGSESQPVNTSDGDVASSIQIFYETGRKKIATTCKTGLGVVIDVEDINNPIYSVCQYIGPQSIFGGSNYQCTQDTKSNIFCCQPNINSLANPFPNPLYTEKMVTRDGEYIPIGQSFMACFDIQNGIVKWNTKLDSLAFAQPAGVNGCVLSLDLTGKFYAHDMFDGKLLWKLDNSESKHPTKGGIAGACVLNDKIIWCPNYRMPIFPSPSGPDIETGSNGKYGIILSINKCNVLNNKCTREYVGHKFEGKLSDGTIIRQKWKRYNTIISKIHKYQCITICLNECNQIINPTIFNNLAIMSKLVYQMEYMCNGITENVLFNRICIA